MSGDQEFVCGWVILFKDGGEPEFGPVLYRGKREDCERVLDQIPAIAYSGGRPIERCVPLIVPTAEIGAVR